MMRKGSVSPRSPKAIDKQTGKATLLRPVTVEFIENLRGCCKGEDSLVDAREHEHREESFADVRWRVLVLDQTDGG
jgi:hypothetical protein